MKQLTYADRELLLQTFDSLKDGWEGQDDDLLSRACKWAKSITPTFGFEHALTRDVAVLSRYLVDRKDDQDIADIARGGLLYVLNAGEHGLPKLRDFGLLDDAFVSSYALHEIRTRLGEPAAYNPPHLTRAEQQRAENLFLEFVAKPAERDSELISQARRTVESLSNLAASGLFRRLQKNIDFLAAVLIDGDYTAEQKSYARAALGYISCEQDAIDDRLGLVGYFDDNFIAQLAVDLIEPNREPWLELLDATVGAWPFLNGFLLDDGTCVRPLSEYMIINSALTCADVRIGSDLTTTILVVPVTGPTPFVLGVIATIGLVQQSGQRNVNEESFRTGQRVIVDHCAIAEFVGFKEFDDRRMFGLAQYYDHRGHKSPTIHYWPISDLRRLVPADRSRATRGTLTHDLGRSDALLPGLEYLFNASKTAELSAVTKRVIVVMPVAKGHDLAKNLSLHGIPLKNVLPMGHLWVDDEERDDVNRIKPRAWSNQFGLQEPLLLVASDVDTACEYAEEHDEQIELVIVDSTGRNANKTASLQRLRHFHIPTLVVSAERSLEELSIDEEETGVWEWSEDDFASLLWPLDTTEGGSGPLVHLERRLQQRSTAKPILHTINFESAEEAFHAVRHLRSLARARGEEQLVELDDIVSLTYSLMSRLFRTAVALSDSTPSTKEIDAGLRKLLAIRDGSRFLTEKERSAVGDGERSLRQLFERMRTDNPKVEAIKALLADQPDLTLICPDKRLCIDLETHYPNSQTLFSYPEEQGEFAGVIIPGWFRKDRMAALLIPPVTQPIHIVLFGIEQKWYTAFRRERRSARDARAARGGRSKLFPNVNGWRKPQLDPSAPAESDHDTSLQELEAIQRDIRSGYRQRIYRAARSNDIEAEVPARLVMFDGGAYAFLTESYRANVVTHLLDNAVDDSDDKADVKQKLVSQLVPGEALLFHRGSNRDVIRTTADTILPAGRRDTSSLWRTALLEYAEREQLSAEQLHGRLREGGCPLKLLTIKLWLDNDDMIAPQAYKRDVDVIANVTKDGNLVGQMDDVLAAISEVRSAHLRASHLLAKKVLSQAVNILKAEGELTSMIELEANVVIVRVVEIDDAPILVRASLTNRLLEGESWHE
jgi:uncharacterized membrane protein YkvA (DUF1232 family)